MHMTITRGALAAAVKSIAGAVPRDNLNPWRFVRIDAADGHVTLTACDGDIQIERRAAANVEEPGVVLVPGRQFVAFANALPEGLCKICTPGTGKVKIMAGAAQFGMGATGVEDWPVFMGPGEKEVSVFLPSVTLREMLRKTAWAASRDATRKTLRCVHAELAGSKLTLVACDGKRLGMCEYELDADAKAEVSFPEKLVGVLQSILGSDGDARLAFDRRAIRVTGEDWSVTSRAIEDVYPAWRRVVPGEQPCSVSVNRPAFLDEVTRAALCAPDTGAVKVAFKGNTIDFSAVNDTVRYSSSIAAKTANGDAGEFSFDYKLLKDALGCLDDDDVTFCYSPGGKTPLVVKSTIPWLAVVMPLRKE